MTSIDEIAGFKFLTILALDQHNVVKVRHILTNLKEGRYQINCLANSLPLPERAKELLTYYGRWVQEFQ